MRVISGKFKGVKLLSPSGEVRPTTDLAKGSLFSMLESKGRIAGADCLDLFCGTGALGIEALSRGARSCVFADLETRNVSSNLSKLGISERVIRADFRRALKLLRGQAFDLVFCDPPYKTDYAAQAYELLVRYRLLGDSGIAVLEHAREHRLTNIPNDRVMDSREFGVTAFDLVGGSNESDNSGNV